MQAVRDHAVHRPCAKWFEALSGSGTTSELFNMSHHKHPPAVMRVFIACSPTYRNRRALMEALGSIFIDTIEQQREYYFFDCPAMNEIFDDGVFNRANFRELPHGPDLPTAIIKDLNFAYVVAGGDDKFVGDLLSEIGGGEALLVRLA
jgi:hypothetical protein